MRSKNNTAFGSTFTTPWPLPILIVLLSLSVLPSATIISTSIQVMASVEDNQESDGNDGDNQ